jgi:hypothetical protein
MRGPLARCIGRRHRARICQAEWRFWRRRSSLMSQEMFCAGSWRPRRNQAAADGSDCLTRPRVVPARILSSPGKQRMRSSSRMEDDNRFILPRPNEWSGRIGLPHIVVRGRWWDFWSWSDEPGRRTSSRPALTRCSANPVGEALLCARACRPSNRRERETKNGELADENLSNLATFLAMRGT